MSSVDMKIKALWEAGETLDRISEEVDKTPTSVAHKMVRMGLAASREDVNDESRRRGGSSLANAETDGRYTIYLIRSPITNEPVYVGQTQNFSKRRKAHVRRFEPILGAEPVIESVIEVADYNAARDEERLLIARLTAEGFTLLNVQEMPEIKKSCTLSL